MYVRISTGSAWKSAVQDGWHVDDKFGASLTRFVDSCLWKRGQRAVSYTKVDVRTGHEAHSILTDLTV